MEYWLKQNLPRVDKCLVKRKDTASQTPTKLVDLTSAFFVLGTGIVLTFFCFLLEVIYIKLQSKPRKRKRLVVYTNRYFVW